MAQMAALLQTQRSTITANDVRPSASNVDPGVSKEDQLENQRRQDKMIELLVKIEKNTADTLKSATKSGTKQTGEGAFGIGALGTALAAGLGAIVGYIKGYVTLLGKLAKVLIPDKWVAAIKTGFDAIVDFFGKIGVLITKGFEKIKSLFVFDEASRIGKVIAAVKDSITKFTKIFSGVVKIFSKLALPLTVIMTLWDTVKGFIEGFEKGGIIEGVAGAVKGFFNSLIFAPLDMLKNATAWVLGIFGFDKAKAALESFSFEKLFSELIDTLVKPFIWIKDKAIELWNNFDWDETWASITGFITESIGSVVSGFGKLKDGIVEWWDSWSINDVIDGIANQVSEISSAISKWFAHKLDKVKSFFGFGSAGAKGTNLVKPSIKQDSSPTDSTMSKIKSFFGFKETPATIETTAAKIVPVTPNVTTVQAVAKPVEPPRTAVQVSSASAAVEEAKIFAMKPVTGSSTTAVVNAPVTNNQNNLIKSNIRNQESSLSRYYQSRYT